MTVNRKVTVNVRRVGAVIATVAAIFAVSALAQTAKDVKGATPLVAIPNEPPPKLIVDPPIPEQLALGRVFIQYRTENLRLLPVFGNSALTVSPRIGHLHYYVDGQSSCTCTTSAVRSECDRCAPAQAGIGGRDAQADPRVQQSGGVHHSSSQIAAHDKGNFLRR